MHHVPSVWLCTEVVAHTTLCARVFCLNFRSNSNYISSHFPTDFSVFRGSWPRSFHSHLWMSINTMFSPSCLCAHICACLCVCTLQSRYSTARFGCASQQRSRGESECRKRQVILSGSPHAHTLTHVHALTHSHTVQTHTITVANRLTFQCMNLHLFPGDNNSHLRKVRDPASRCLQFWETVSR